MKINDVRKSITKIRDEKVDEGEIDELCEILNEENKTNKVFISRDIALRWLNEKCKELGVDSLLELEEYADSTDDLALRVEINKYIMAYQ